MTHRHHRGEFTQPKEEVRPAAPAFLPQLPADAPSDRLVLARWLVSSDNPLTARVTVNRHWQAFFGRGLVKTLEDFGYQSDPPSHPDLLDWLAVTFMRDLDWSMKKLHRLIVTSATYRQASTVAPDLAARDPDNVLLARGPRVRLEAEVIRDSMLAAAGLLSTKMGGPGVRPPQPEGVTEVAYGSPMFVEVARALGAAAMQAGPADATRLDGLGRRLLSRGFDADETAALAAYLAAQRQRLAAGELDAAKLTGEAGPDAAERAAWMLVARAAMNLDEAIVKR